MRIRTDSIVIALVILSFVSGAVGCRSNGGPWYNPKSYSWHNPFKSEEAASYDSEGTAHAANPRPSALSQPNVSTPPGGYTSKEDESRFFANGKKDGTAVVVPQYQAGTDANRVASTGVPAALSAPDHSYNPYGAPDNGLTVATSPAPGYQPTNYQVPSATPQTQPGSYPASPTASYPPASTYSPYANPAPYSAETTHSAPAVANNYSPYGAVPAQEATSVYANPQPAYQAVPAQPAAPTNPYGVPTATPYNVDPAAGFTANPSSYQPGASYQPTYQPATPPTGF